MAGVFDTSFAYDIGPVVTVGAGVGVGVGVGVAAATGAAVVGLLLLSFCVVGGGLDFVLSVFVVAVVVELLLSGVVVLAVVVAVGAAGVVLVVVVVVAGVVGACIRRNTAD